MFRIKGEYFGCLLLRMKRLQIIQIRYPGLNVDTSELTLFPLCEKALLSSCQFQLPPTAASQAHTHADTHITRSSAASMV